MVVLLVIYSQYLQPAYPDNVLICMNILEGSIGIKYALVLVFYTRSCLCTKKI